MPCGGCQKKRRPNNKLAMNAKFLKKCLREARAMKDANLSEKTNKELTDYHRKCHMLYSSNMKNKPINKSFINSIVEFHNRTAKQMSKRTMKHNTPMSKI